MFLMSKWWEMWKKWKKKKLGKWKEEKKWKMLLLVINAKWICCVHHFLCVILVLIFALKFGLLFAFHIAQYMSHRIAVVNFAHSFFRIFGESVGTVKRLVISIEMWCVWIEWAHLSQNCEKKDALLWCFCYCYSNMTTMTTIDWTMANWKCYFYNSMQKHNQLPPASLVCSVGNFWFLSTESVERTHWIQNISKWSELNLNRNWICRWWIETEIFHWNSKQFGHLENSSNEGMATKQEMNRTPSGWHMFNEMRNFASSLTNDQSFSYLFSWVFFDFGHKIIFDTLPTIKNEDQTNRSLVWCISFLLVYTFLTLTFFVQSLCFQMERKVFWSIKQCEQCRKGVSLANLSIQWPTIKIRRFFSEHSTSHYFKHLYFSILIVTICSVCHLPRQSHDGSVTHFEWIAIPFRSSFVFVIKEKWSILQAPLATRKQ